MKFLVELMICRFELLFLEVVGCETVMGTIKAIIRYPIFIPCREGKFFTGSYASLTNQSTLVVSSRPFYFPFLNDFPTFISHRISAHNRSRTSRLSITARCPQRSKRSKADPNHFHATLLLLRSTRARST